MEEYVTAIRTTALGFTSGRIYDALLLACAAKWQAKAIYSWNLKYYRASAPDLAGNIKNP